MLVKSHVLILLGKSYTKYFLQMKRDALERDLQRRELRERIKWNSFFNNNIVHSNKKNWT